MRSRSAPPAPVPSWRARRTPARARDYRLLSFAVLAAVAWLSACSPAGGPTPPAPSEPERSDSPGPGGPGDVERDPTALELAMLDAVNDARASGRTCGAVPFGPAPPLAIEGRLTAAAQGHAADMLATGELSHTGSNGSSLKDRVEDQRYQWSRLAENVAWGFEDVATVVDGWLGSPGHCENMMDPDLTELGVGRADLYWVQVFGAPR